MNVNEVNDIINNICEKIGIGIESAKNFVPMLAKYMILHSAFWAFFYLILFAGILFAVKKLSQVYKNADIWDRDFYFFGFVCCGISGTVLFAVIMGYIFDVIEWMACPKVMAVKYILEMFGGK